MTRTMVYEIIITNKPVIMHEDFSTDIIYLISGSIQSGNSPNQGPENFDAKVQNFFH